MKKKIIVPIFLCVSLLGVCIFSSIKPMQDNPRTMAQDNPRVMSIRIHNV